MALSYLQNSTFVPPKILVYHTRVVSVRGYTHGIGTCERFEVQEIAAGLRHGQLVAAKKQGRTAQALFFSLSFSETILGVGCPRRRLYAWGL
jgi:hypothetical protein